jgi:hypothetical protein
MIQLISIADAYLTMFVSNADHGPTIFLGISLGVLFCFLDVLIFSRILPNYSRYMEQGFPWRVPHLERRLYAKSEAHWKRLWRIEGVILFVVSAAFFILAVVYLIV